MAKRSIPLEVLDLNGNGFHLLINIKLLNKRFKLVVDTGASKTAFDKTLLSELIHEKELKAGHLTTGLGTNNMESFITEVENLYIGKFCISVLEVAVLDLSAINIAYQKLEIEPVLGVLGGDILMQHQAIIDYAKRKLILTTLD